jgi:hypothetical protein
MGQLSMAGSGALGQAAGKATYFTAALPETSAGYKIATNHVSAAIVMGQDAAIPNACDLFVDQTASLKLSGHALLVDGDFKATISNTPGTGLVMTDPADKLEVNGNATFTVAAGHGSATMSGYLTAGEIHVRSSFSQTKDDGWASGYGFVSTGTTVFFDGSAGQEVSFANPALTSSRFDDVVVSNVTDKGVTLVTNAFATGDFDLKGVMTVPAAKTLAISGKLYLRSTSKLYNYGSITKGSCSKEAGATVVGTDPCP